MRSFFTAHLYQIRQSESFSNIFQHVTLTCDSANSTNLLICYVKDFFYRESFGFPPTPNPPQKESLPLDKKMGEISNLLLFSSSILPTLSIPFHYLLPFFFCGDSPKNSFSSNRQAKQLSFQNPPKSHAPFPYMFTGKMEESNKSSKFPPFPFNPLPFSKTKERRKNSHQLSPVIAPTINHILGSHLLPLPSNYQLATF